MSSAINSSKPMQITAARVVAGAMVNSKQCDRWSLSIFGSPWYTSEWLPKFNGAFLVQNTSVENFHEDTISSSHARLLKDRQTNAG